MSLWRFILTDRNGIKNVVPDPVNWQDPEVVIARETENGWHGIFFDYGIDKLQFNELGAELIKAEYEEYGINGQMRIDIQFKCSEDNLYDDFYSNGKIAFDQYSDTCGDECSVSVGVEDSSDIMQFKNNYEQSVNINSNIAFDQTTVLTDYEWLNKDILIPNRGLPLTVAGNSPGGQHSLYPISVRETTPVVGTAIRIRPELTQNSIAEINTSDPSGASSYAVFPQTAPNIYPTGITPFLKLDELPNCSTGVFDYYVRLKGRIRGLSTVARDVTISIFVVNDTWSDVNDPNIGTALLLPTTHYGATGTPAGPDITFDQIFQGSCNIDAGKPFAAFINYITYYNVELTENVYVDWDAETSLKLTTVSNCAPTTSKITLINEAASRVIESVTNDTIRFYSETFGRTDSQPYSINTDSCAGLFSITDGLNIRRKLLLDNSQPGFFITPKQLFEGLKPIWNIGITIEPDPNRIGFKRLRFEDWKFFYQEDVAVNFPYATNINREVDLSRIFNKITVGYTNWEAEGTTGLYELMTSREYRINITAISKELNIETDFICAPYTVEITRRLDSSTEDWQYDNNIFGFCLKRDSDGFEVELFPDIASNISNVLDPNSGYNARITPVRNLMRWFSYIMQGLRKLQSDSKIIFSSGTGNYIAALQTNKCNIEGKILSESEDIDITDFADKFDAYPLTFSELVTFDHPMNYNTFKRIKDDPTIRYKAIRYVCNGINKEGWLQQISYRPLTGMANISIIPKNDLLVIPPQPPTPSCNAAVSDIMLTSPDPNKLIVDWTDSAAGATFYNIKLFKDGTEFNNGYYNGHPIQFPGIASGNYHVIVIPYCDANLPGTNYVEGDITVSDPSFALILSAVLTTGRQPNNKLQLTATGTIASTSGFSFKFGQCTVNTTSSSEACRAFPGSPVPNPTSTVTFFAGDITKTVESAQVTPGADFGYITKIVIYDLVGITAAQITKAAGQTWTLVIQ